MAIDTNSQSGKYSDQLVEFMMANRNYKIYTLTPMSDYKYGA